MGASGRESRQESGFVDLHFEEQNQIADHILGVVARRNGEPFDRTKSAAWQRGWVGLGVSVSHRDLLKIFC